MSQKVYVDTNVFIDYLDDRFEPAADFFEAVVGCSYTIVISSLVVEELRRQEVHCALLFGFLDSLHKLEVIPVNKQHHRLAGDFTTHRADALHAAVAIDAGVPIITRNRKDFENTGVVLLDYGKRY